MQVLFVCTGNTCRSPMAEYLFNTIAMQQGYKAQAASAGIAALDGSPAANKTERALAEMDIKLQEHQARNVTGAMVEDADWVITMTEAQKYVLHDRYPQHREKIVMLGELCSPVREVDDPFGAPYSAYQACSRQLKLMIEEALPIIMNGKEQSSR